MRGTAELGPFSLAARELQPMEVRTFRWWEDELASIKAAEAEAEAEAEKEKEAVAGGGAGGGGGRRGRGGVGERPGAEETLHHRPVR
jgi:hypothetical protein